MIADALKISADDILEDVLDYPHISPFEEANNILMDCNPDEERMLISVLRFITKSYIPIYLKDVPRLRLGITPIC